MRILSCKYGFNTKRGFGGEAPAAGEDIEFFYENNAFLIHNFGNLRGVRAPVALPSGYANVYKNIENFLSATLIVSLLFMSCYSISFNYDLQ